MSRATPDTAKKKVHLVSLGCPKNRVDSEVLLGVAMGGGFTHVDDASEAEMIVVNTCGFIGEAKKESIDTIFEMARYKETGSCKKLVVTGCLSQRHPTELAEQIPEIDHLLGSSDMMKLGKVLRGEADRIEVGTPADWLIAANSPRILSTRQGSAYVKIAEGCNRTCSFCVIPDLRGKQRSRAIADVVREVEQLIDQGVKEVNLISQDTIAYGRDREERPKLADLVKAVADVKGLSWLRLFYLYPEALTSELIELLADHPVVVPYVDMPLQHAADGMLRRMRRGHGGARLRTVVDRMRKSIPNLTFRTAFIIGHPGETDEELDELVDFIEWARFERVGFFRYSDEETSRSFALPDKVPARTAAKRYRRIVEVQRKIQHETSAAMVGKELEVLVEGVSDEHEFVLMGRHPGQAPEIDGQVYLSGGDASAGELRRVTITQASDCDLVGELHGSAPGESQHADQKTKRPARRRLPMAARG